MIRFRIYYDDGSTYDGNGSLDSAINAPTVGAQVIVYESANSRGRSLVHSKDYYYFKDGLWNGCDWGGLFDYLTQMGFAKVLLFGRTMMRNDDFYAIQARATREGLGDDT